MSLGAEKDHAEAPRNPFAFGDLVEEWRSSLYRLDLCWALALEDLQDRFRRSIIGILWVTVSFLLFVGIKVVVFGALNEMSGTDFAIYLTIGLAIWTFISSTINDAAYSLIRSKTWILSSNLPFAIYMIQVVLRNLINFLLIWLAAMLIWLVTAPVFSWSLLTIFPAVILYTITAVWVCALFGPVCARYRDLLYGIQTTMRLMLFATPIIWVPQIGTHLELLANINPFYHFIEIVRAPMMGKEIPMLSWTVSVAVTVVGLVAGAVSYIATRSRVAYWL